MEVLALALVCSYGDNEVMVAPDSGRPPVRPFLLVTPSAWLRWAPVPLLGVAVLLGWLLTPVLVDPGRMRGSLLPTLVLASIRTAAEVLHDRVRVGSRAVVAGYTLHGLVLVVAVALNPFVCIYAFVGYLDAERFLGERWVLPALVVTGLTCGFGQAGGLPGVTATPALFVGLAAVNVTLALIVGGASQAREREVAAREDAVHALARAHAENLTLHTQLVQQAHEKGIVEERARLSRELHDTVAQGLVGVIRQLELSADLDAAAQLRVDRATQTARDCLDETRRAVRALGPQQLQDADLVDAVRAVVQTWSLTSGVVAHVRVHGTPVPGTGDDVVVRVVQEALANVARHAAARTLSVTFSWLSEELVVEVSDDGVGFEPGAVVRGRGLDGMAERLAAVGGRLVLESRPGAGTTVVAVLPL